MPDVVEILKRTEAYFKERGVPDALIDAQLVVGHVLGLDRMSLYLQFDRPLTEAELDTLRPLVRRRGKREPLHWILGERGFHAIDLAIHSGVLVPRPDTETLVDAALEHIPLDQDPVYVADLGCGTGAVGLAVAVARPGVRLFAVDLSDAALQNTRENVKRLALSGRVAVLRGDLLDAVPASRQVDWVLSNPPYVPAGDLDGLMPEVSQWEPRLALDGGADGLDVVRRIVDQARARARKGLFLEIGAGQAPAVAALLSRAGFEQVHVRADLAGIGRVVGGLQPPGSGQA